MESMKTPEKGRGNFDSRSSLHQESLDVHGCGGSEIESERTGAIEKTTRHKERRKKVNLRFLSGVTKP